MTDHNDPSFPVDRELETYEGQSTPDAADLMLERTLEAAISGLQGLAPSESAAAESLDRIWARVSAALPVAAVELRECADYQTLLPALLTGELPAGRRLLVEDHTRSCLTCRRELRRLQAGPRRVEESTQNAPSTVARWALAAGVLAATALSFFAFWNYGPVSQRQVAQVRQIDGQLFALDEDGLRPLYPGDRVDGERELRTSKLGGAVLELNDGSRVEVDARSVFELERRRGGDRIRVERGRAIVEAAKQRGGTLDVLTSEMRVSVKGTIFAVSHGAKGSRVSVLEGRVAVSQGVRHASLLPGQQMTSRATMTAVPLSEDLEWSGQYERYVALLSELRELQSDLVSLIAEVPRRTSSTLLPLAPAATTVYIGLPNPSATLADVYELIRQRVAANPELFSFWNELQASPEMAHLDSVVGYLREVGDLLGDETVIALRAPQLHDAPFGEEQELSGVVLSEVRDAAALRASLQAKLDELGQEAGEPLPVFILDSLDDPAPPTEGAIVWISDDLLVASSDYDLVRTIALGQGDGFAATGFGQAVARAYAAGAQLVGAVDLASIFAGVVAEEDRQAVQFAGFDNVEYLLVERHQDGERAHTAAELTFDGERRGVASWLAAPAPMGALEFVSPNATFVTASVLKDPLDMLDDLLALASGVDGDLEEALGKIQEETGLDVRSDLVAPMGGESAFALDGPALPVPSWKYILEVYDPMRLQNTLRVLTDKLRTEGHEVTVSEASLDGRTYHELSFETGESSLIKKISVHYTYVDGFLVAGPTRALVDQAIANRDGHNSILGSADFQSVLPTDGYVDFSAIVYNRLGEVLQGLVKHLPMPEGITDEQRAVIDDMVEGIAERGPSLFCLYGEDERIRLVSNTSALMPFAGLDAAFGLGGLLSGLDLGGIAGAIGQAVPGVDDAQDANTPKSVKLEA